MTIRQRLQGRFTGWTVALLALCLLVAGWTSEARADDAPARAARLSFLQGNVTVDHVG